MTDWWWMQNVISLKKTWWNRKTLNTNLYITVARWLSFTKPLLLINYLTQLELSIWWLHLNKLISKSKNKLKKIFWNQIVEFLRCLLYWGYIFLECFFVILNTFNIDMLFSRWNYSVRLIFNLCEGGCACIRHVV